MTHMFRQCRMVLFPFVLLCFNLNAQCPGVLSCDSAQVFCNLNSLNGFRCATTSVANVTFPYQGLCFGAGTPQNLHWWAFVGNGSPLTLTFSVDGATCEFNQGIQAGVFEGDCSGARIWDCSIPCLTSTFVLRGETKSCQTYYAWVDGCNGDECTYLVSVGGISNPPELPEIDTFIQS